MRETTPRTERVRLHDGREVLVRAIRRDDAPLLIDLHSRLSSDTQYLRFFGPKPELTPDEADYLAGVDFEARVAIVATADEDGAERIVAVGRYDVTDEGDAECAIVVRDDHQARGLGSAILDRLVGFAASRGIRSFSGEVLPENAGMLGLLRRYGLDVDLPDEGAVRVRAELDVSAEVVDGD